MNTSYQHIISTHPINSPPSTHHYNILTHPINTLPYQCILSTHPFQPIYQYILSTHPSQCPLSTHPNHPLSPGKLFEHPASPLHPFFSTPPLTPPHPFITPLYHPSSPPLSPTGKFFEHPASPMRFFGTEQKHSSFLGNLEQHAQRPGPGSYEHKTFTKGRVGCSTNLLQILCVCLFLITTNVICSCRLFTSR